MLYPVHEEFKSAFDIFKWPEGQTIASYKSSDFIHTPLSEIQPRDRCITFNGRYESGGTQVEYWPLIAHKSVFYIENKASATIFEISSGTWGRTDKDHSGYRDVVVSNGKVESGPRFLGSNTLIIPV